MNRGEADHRREVGGGFWLQWTLVSMGGWFAGAFIGQIVSSFLGMGIALVSAGTVVGLAQWITLRSWVNRAVWWVPATAAGVALAGTAGGVVVWIEFPITETGQPPFIAVAASRLEGLLIGGFVPGLLQWLALRQWVRRAGWWLPGSALAWAAGIAVVGQLTTDLQESVLRGGLDGLEAIVVGMTVTAALTGLLLRWLLERPRSSAQHPSDDRWGSFTGGLRRPDREG